MESSPYGPVLVVGGDGQGTHRLTPRDSSNTGGLQLPRAPLCIPHERRAVLRQGLSMTLSVVVFGRRKCGAGVRAPAGIV